MMKTLKSHTMLNTLFVFQTGLTCCGYHGLTSLLPRVECSLNPWSHLLGRRQMSHPLHSSPNMRILIYLDTLYDI